MTGEWVVQVYSHRADDDSAIYAVGFITNWGRDTGFMTAGIPGGDPTNFSTDYAPAHSDVDYSEQLVFIEYTTGDGSYTLKPVFAEYYAPVDPT